MRKVLYSPGFGAGWYTWNTGEIGKYILEYKPIIEFIEAGNSFTRKECQLEFDEGSYDLSKLHPILRQLAEECQLKFDEVPYMGGAVDLRVLQVDGPVRIDDYDGNESIEVAGQYDGWV